MAKEKSSRQKEKKNRVTKNTGKDSEVFFLSFLNYI